ncbi:hypothetical protein UFOVP529_47 [uncultured Caudovirales phage]|uniref:Uncharacterized protein n=1 Tax=uncultured Caudovirales phage TaxID=2100421 RepID=A0A6J5MVX2_9CAUD|nr:hypothetical protein UFOVP529_47 [uncultured Caudovirales phage]CAB4190747.1 hypothetical protein UFOVP1191_105 [uncultured Caudovirales phage]CAB4194462.1 hypothetical protein UFOVP1252_73 [uncultured Caudovirales phage]
MYKVVVVDAANLREPAISELVGIGSLEVANSRAKSEAYDTAEVLLGEWRVVRESVKGGKYGARLEPTTGDYGYIVVMVVEQ